MRLELTDRTGVGIVRMLGCRLDVDRCRAVRRINARCEAVGFRAGVGERVFMLTAQELMQTLPPQHCPHVED